MSTAPPRILQARLENRTDFAVNWTAINPILLPGEIGFEEDTGLFKIGRANLPWNSLPYAGGGGTGGGSASGNVDGGTATSNETGTPTVDGGNATSMP